MMAEEFFAVGKSFPRKDSLEKAIGDGLFGADIRMPRMLVGKILRNPYAHARILRVHTEKAERLPGVKSVLTAKNTTTRPFNSAVYQEQLENQRIFDDEVRFVGDAVAGVVAVNEEVAEVALGLIEVEYKPLPAVFDPVESMRPCAPRVHSTPDNNIAAHLDFGWGDIDAGFKEADYVFEDTFSTSGQKHCQLEPDACIARYGLDGQLSVWTPTQEPHITRFKLARLFDLRESQVRIINPLIGGGFGARNALSIEPWCVAMALKVKGRPVRLQYTREEDFVTRVNRFPMIYNLKIGVKKSGSLVAMRADVVADAGAYATHVPGVVALSGSFLLSRYKCQNTKFLADVVYTNKQPAGAFRGYGNPQATFGLEVMMDRVAEQLGVDPVEIRLNNHLGVGDIGLFQIPFSSVGIDECLKKGAEAIGWKEKMSRTNVQLTHRRGVGVAISTHGSGGWPAILEHTASLITINPDGSANLILGSTDMGQGCWTSLSQIAAEELGIRFEDIIVIRPDTSVSLYDSGSHASRQVYVAGTAVKIAAANAKRQLLERASKVLSVSVNDLEAKNGEIYIKNAPEKSVAIRQLAADSIVKMGACGQIIGRSSYEPKSNAPSWQATFAEVEVDIETGQVKVVKLVVAHDIGRAINPAIVEGQIQGAALQGIGYTLTEDLLLTKDGKIPNPNFTDYKIPSTLEVPDIEVILVESNDPTGPFGAKGVGEQGLVNVAPAIANAIYSAIGKRFKELPITPETILRVLKDQVIQ